MSAMADLAESIRAYECGELNEAEAIELFQNLVDSGLAWSLQGSYGRMARDLIATGHVTVGINSVSSW